MRFTGIRRSQRQRAIVAAQEAQYLPMKEYRCGRCHSLKWEVDDARPGV
jgi:hypothetical protein